MLEKGWTQVKLKPFDDPRYVFELKLDGFRALASVADGTAWLVSRRQHRFKRFAPHLHQAITPTAGRPND